MGVEDRTILVCLTVAWTVFGIVWMLVQSQIADLRQKLSNARTDLDELYQKQKDLKDHCRTEHSVMSQVMHSVKKLEKGS